MKEARSGFSISENTLKDILEKNKDTVYGRDHCFEMIHNQNQWRTQHPLTRYDDFQQYMDRIAQGEENVSTTEKVQMLGLTSGN